jgi:hypothetical protein
MRKDYSALWTKLEAEIAEAVSTVAPTLVSSHGAELAFVEEMLHHREYGLALEHLAAALHEARTPINRRTYELIERAGLSMYREAGEPDPATWECIRSNIVE